MSRYSRGPLPPEDEARFESQTKKILAALREGQKTTSYLAAIAGDKSRRIWDLRDKGYHIRSEYIKGAGGEWLYSILDKPDPAYEVTVQSTFPDGHVWKHKVIVNANNAQKARNCAQHGQIKTKILEVRRLEPEPEPEPEPKQPNGHPPKGYFNGVKRGK